MLIKENYQDELMPELPNYFSKAEFILSVFSYRL